jgi:type I restriction enzyme R subunit
MLEKVNLDETKQSQLTSIELLLNMGYKYISIEEALKQRGGDTSNFILSDIAVKKLMEINGYDIDGVEYKFSSKDIRDIIDELEHIQYEGLIDTSQNIYNIIMPTYGGKTVKVNHDGRKISKNFRFIDFANVENNNFHVTAEFSASGKGNIRPDIVCFVNGIPFAVIENKKSSVDVIEAINQMNRNQGQEFCPKLYTYTQLLVATNGKELQYGTTGTPNKFYVNWKEKGTEQEDLDKKIIKLIKTEINEDTYSQVLQDLNGYTVGHEQRINRIPTNQDRGITSLFEPKRLLDLTKNYILFDAGVKKLSRYQQYFAIHKMLKRIEEEEIVADKTTRRKGGLVWHTQGSGKSLTMVMFVKALIEDPNIINPRVIIVTDRRDLDRQIRDTFKNCNLKKDVVQATSGQHLLDLIKEKNLGVITTIIDKFESASKKYANFVDTDSNIFVLIDEAHRSQSGTASFEMNRIIPNACYIGFTGTPLMKTEKESWRKFGGYIDKYTIDDALSDKIILPLIYEGRYTKPVQNKEQIDRRVDLISEDLSKKYEGSKIDQRHKLKLQKEITESVIKNNPQIIEEIARDIENHFISNFKDTGLKAQIVAPSKYAATVFQNYFESKTNINTAIVISDEHDDGDQENSHKQEVLKYLSKIRENHSSVSKYEKDVIESFKHNEAGVEIIIVVDKLLTGFDAPRNTVLYLTKDLHDHGLLQAIARVNRLFENKKLPKTAGYIIDYSENAKNIDIAMKLFGNYDENDVKGTLIDVSEKINELEQSYGLIHDLFNEIKNSSDDEVYLQFLKDEAKREMFYKSLNDFIRNLNECFVLQDFVSEFKDKFDMYKKDLKKFMEIRKSASLLYKEKVDLSEYKESLVKILDKYIDAKGVELLTKQINITDREQFKEAIENLGSDKSKAEAIAAQTERTISEQMEKDPEFFERFSKKIENILEKMRLGKLADIEALKQMKLISEDVLSKRNDNLPKGIKDMSGADIFYRNLQPIFKDLNIDDFLYAQIIIEIFSIIKQEAIIDWYKNLDVKRKIMNVLDDYLYDEVKVKKELNIDSEFIKLVINNTMQLAENNFEIFK